MKSLCILGPSRRSAYAARPMRNAIAHGDSDGRTKIGLQVPTFRGACVPYAVIIRFFAAFESDNPIGDVIRDIESCAGILGRLSSSAAI